MADKPGPTFHQSLLVRNSSRGIGEVAHLSLHPIGWCGSWYIRGPSLLSHRYDKNPPSIRPGFRASWRIEGYLQRGRKRGCWQRTRRYAPQFLAPNCNGVSHAASHPPAAIFFATYDTMKQTLPFAAPITHMLSACTGEVVSPRTWLFRYSSAEETKRQLA